jgi:hypothetical protein
MLDLRARLRKTKTDHARTVIERQTEATDREASTPSTGSGPELVEGSRAIDRLVYELYGLSEEEIRLVEEATK